MMKKLMVVGIVGMCVAAVTPITVLGMPESTGSSTNCDSEGGICVNAKGFSKYSSAGSEPLKGVGACGENILTKKPCGGSIAVTAEIEKSKQ